MSHNRCRVDDARGNYIFNFCVLYIYFCTVRFAFEVGFFSKKKLLLFFARIYEWSIVNILSAIDISRICNAFIGKVLYLEMGPKCRRYCCYKNVLITYRYVSVGTTNVVAAIRQLLLIMFWKVCENWGKLRLPWVRVALLMIHVFFLKCIPSFITKSKENRYTTGSCCYIFYWITHIQTHNIKKMLWQRPGLRDSIYTM